MAVKWTEEEIGSFIVSDLENELGAIALSYIATLERIDLMLTEFWEKGEITGKINRWEKKEVEGTASRYAIFIHEMSMLALAKAVEDVQYDMNERLNMNFDIFKTKMDHPHLLHTRTCKSLSNVSKHNRSLLVEGSSRSADYIIKEWGLNSGWDLGTYILARHELFNILEYIPKMYLCLCAIIQELTDYKSPLYDDDWTKTSESLYRVILPQSFGIEVPKPEKQ